MTRDEIIERMNWLPSASHTMSDVLDRIEKTVRAAEREARDQAVTAEREACIKIIEAYQIPVGNSAAGEMARDWTYDALMEIRDEIRARG